MLKLTAIQKSFGANTVLSIDDLVFKPGIYWLKGANGSGKSTLLKLLAGLLPFKGEVILNGNISIHKQAALYRAAINHSPAEPVYPSFLTGNELVEFVLNIKKGNTEQVNIIKSILDIGHYLANPTGSYSSGMLKKLSLLLAFIGTPAWILLDEPLTTLDHASQKALCSLIMQQSKNGTSFIFTSHHDVETSDINFTKTFLLKEQQLVETK